jgi:hypothetical protein
VGGAVTPDQKAVVEALRAAVASQRLYLHVKREDAETLLDAIEPDTFGLVGADALLAAVRRVVALGHEQRRWVRAGSAVIFAKDYDHESPEAKWRSALAGLDWALLNLDL